ncbi:hypothetical protein E2C01_021621 [Portunus trituberculatus]|uniref:Uncharacterized protein n=1 Tax=Portunus trituberculatus TaxID=210409 RepID=A0A5B7E3T6_PORTR|nr:hypothetical protein [Portunus trituberculatus]
MNEIIQVQQTVSEIIDRKEKFERREDRSAWGSAHTLTSITQLSHSSIKLLTASAPPQSIKPVNKTDAAHHNTEASSCLSSSPGSLDPLPQLTPPSLQHPSSAVHPLVVRVVGLGGAGRVLWLPRHHNQVLLSATQGATLCHHRGHNHIPCLTVALTAHNLTTLSLTHNLVQLALFCLILLSEALFCLTFLSVALFCLSLLSVALFCLTFLFVALF